MSEPSSSGPHAAQTGAATPKAGRDRPVRALSGRVAWELAVVFAGVLSALWVDNQRDERQRRERVVRIADAASAEITELGAWYRPWRDSVAVDLADWQSRVSEGQRPPPYFFRVPGSEYPPTVAWDAAVGAGVLEVLEPSLVFAVGNAYHEWNSIGVRIARYHALTEQVLFPAIGDMLIDSRSSPYGLDSNRRWREFLVSQQLPAAYDARGRLLPVFAGHAALTEEVLAEMDNKFTWIDEVRVQLEEAVADMRPRR